MKLVNSAYSTGIQTGIVNELPIDVIQDVNKMYTYQNDYNDFGNLLMASLINRDFSGKEEDMRKIARFLSLTITDIVIQENDLISEYQIIKDKLKAYK